MQKATPLANDIDLLLPGENWFLYWKTSSSLWESKISELKKGGRLIIPINWALHYLGNGHYDFASNKPETDLEKLNNIAINLGHNPLFICPVTPAPFIQNGGVPHEVASTKATDRNGLNYTTLDPEGTIIHMYSFFDPAIYKAFRMFIIALGEYFDDKKICSPIWGGECGYFQNGYFSSYINDRSRLFHDAFSRFLSIKKNNSNSSGPLLSSEQAESILAEEFTSTMQELYIGTCQEILTNNWEGDVQIAFIGASPNDTFERVTGSDHSITHSKTLFNMITQDLIPSSIMLPNSHKTDVFKKELDEIVNKTIAPITFQNSISEESETEYALPLRLFTLFESTNSRNSLVKPAWEENGLITHLKKHYNWTYILKEKCGQIQNKGDEFSSIYCFIGQEISLEQYKTIITIFMSGGKILIDINGLSEKIRKRFELFFIENSIKTTELSFHCDLVYAHLGEGRIILFDGVTLKDKRNDLIDDFWEKIINTISITHIQIKHDGDICFFWRTYFDNMSELTYEEVRKLNIYNPSSYKKQLRVPISNNFVLIKASNQSHSSFTTSRNEVLVELLPGGSINFDFGLYSP